MFKNNNFRFLLLLALVVNGTFAGHGQFPEKVSIWRPIAEMEIDSWNPYFRDPLSFSQTLPPIMQAIDKGDVEEVRDIIEKDPTAVDTVWHGPGGHVDYVDRPLLRVSMLSTPSCGSEGVALAVSMIKLLVEKGADVFAKDGGGNNFLMSLFTVSGTIKALFGAMERRIEKKFYQLNLPSHTAGGNHLPLDLLSAMAKKAFAQEVCELLSAKNNRGDNALGIAGTRMEVTAEGRAERAEVVRLLKNAQKFCDRYK